MSVAQWIGRPPVNWKVTGLISGWRTCLGWGPGLGWGLWEATHWCFSLSSMFFSLSFSLPSPLSKNKYIKSLKNYYVFYMFKLHIYIIIVNMIYIKIYRYLKVYPSFLQVERDAFWHISLTFIKSLILIYLWVMEFGILLYDAYGFSGYSRSSLSYSNSVGS